MSPIRPRDLCSSLSQEHKKRVGKRKLSEASTILSSQIAASLSIENDLNDQQERPSCDDNDATSNDESDAMNFQLLMTKVADVVKNESSKRKKIHYLALAPKNWTIKKTKDFSASLAI